MEHVMGITMKAVSALLLLLVLAAAGAQSSIARDYETNPGDFNFAGNAVVLTLTKEQMHPRVIVDLGDGEQYEFIVDTGASVNVIDSKIAESLAYEVIGETEIGAPGGPRIPGNIVRVPVAHVGDATVKNAEFVTMDIDGFSHGQTQGVLGLGLFREYLLSFDQSGGRITVSRDSLSADAAGVLPYRDESSHIQIDVDVAGMTVATHVDTGSMGSFTLPAEMMESLPLLEAAPSATKARLVGGDRDIKFGQLDGTIRFAEFSYENPNVAFMSPSPGYGNVGSRILGELVVSIDQKNHLIAFRKPARDVAASAGNKPRRLGIMFRGMPGGSVLEIGRVDPGSIGETAGLLAGDVLLTLNGRPTAEYDMSELGTLFRSSTPLRFDIERDGVAKTIAIQ
jgi:predicted aspartyl protease